MATTARTRKQDPGPRPASCRAGAGPVLPDPPTTAGVRTGVDLVDVARFQRLLTLRGDLLLERVFTPHELLAARGGPARLAARLAAKEAVAKALGTGIGPIGWRDVEVRDSAGAPIVVLTGAAAALARDRGLRQWAVSLAHAGGFAVAVVLATGGAAS